jgi:hypothetical protein
MIGTHHAKGGLSAPECLTPPLSPPLTGAQVTLGLTLPERRERPYYMRMYAVKENTSVTRLCVCDLNICFAFATSYEQEALAPME